MAKHFYINLSPKNVQERYAMGKFLEFTDNFDPITSDFLLSISNLKLSGTYVIRGEDARPDVISEELFGGTQYWWILMFYNGLSKVDDLVNGKELKVPDTEELERLYFTLKSRELGR